MAKLYTIVLAVIFIVFIQTPCIICKDENPSPNALFAGHFLKHFYDVCTPKAKSAADCPVSTPDDFERLKKAKILVREQVEYFLSMPRLVIMCSLIIVILVMMIHLVLVKHFDWRTLPIVDIFYDIELDQDRRSGVKHHQYIWMKYLVLRGNHTIFRGRDYRDINWHKYVRDVNFDYKSVKVHKFTFLDKKMLTKHLAEDIEKEVADEQQHAGGHPPNANRN